MFDEDSYDYLKCFKHGNDRETCEHCEFIYEHDYSDHDGHEAWDYINKTTENIGSRSGTTTAGMIRADQIIRTLGALLRANHIRMIDMKLGALITEECSSLIVVCDCGAEKVGTTHADWCSTHKMK